MNQNPETQSASSPAVAPDGQSRPGVVAVRASQAVGLARATVRTTVTRLPGTMHATRAGASATTSALQHLPDSTLQGLAAGSVGLGAGFYLAGLPRFVAAVAVAPAMILGAAIALRPAHRLAEADGA